MGLFSRSSRTTVKEQQPQAGRSVRVAENPPALPVPIAKSCQAAATQQSRQQIATCQKQKTAGKAQPDPCHGNGTGSCPVYGDAQSRWWS